MNILLFDSNDIGESISVSLKLLLLLIRSTKFFIMDYFKVWIYQSNRILSSSEEEYIIKYLSNFLNTWAAHGDALKSELKILDHKFMIVQVDESQAKASGCSIDKLNQCIRDIDNHLNLDLLNRLLVSYQNTKDSQIQTVPLHIFKELIKNSEIDSQTLVYNLSVDNSLDFKTKFKLPLKDSWASIYLK